MAKTKSKIKDGSRIFDAFCIFFCALICLVTLYPMYYVLIMSLSEPAAVNSMSVFLYPKGFQLKSYALLFTVTHFRITIWTKIQFLSQTAHFRKAIYDNFLPAMTSFNVSLHK